MKKVLICILIVMAAFGLLLVTACENGNNAKSVPEDQKSWNDVFARMKEFREQITGIASPGDSQEDR